MIVTVMDMNIIQQYLQQSCLSLAWLLAIITGIIILCLRSEISSSRLKIYTNQSTPCHENEENTKKHQIYIWTIFILTTPPIRLGR